MKKLLFSTFCSFALAGLALAQNGSVNWAAIDFADMTAQTNNSQISPFFGGGSTGGIGIGAAGGSASLGTGFYYEFLFTSYNGGVAPQPTSFAQLATWTDSGLEASNSLTAGRLSAMNPHAGVNVSGFSEIGTSNTNSIMLFGWSANLGSTYSTAISTVQLGNYFGNAYIGESAIGYTQGLAPGTAPGASLFGSAQTAFGQPIFSLNTQLYLAVTPEPSTIALAAFGSLSLLAVRRRKP